MWLAILLIELAILAAFAAFWYIQKRAEQDEDAARRAELRWEQHRTEQRLQHMARRAMQSMLDESRRAPREWEQSSDR